MSTKKRWAPQPTFSDLIPRPETHSRKCSRMCRLRFLGGWLPGPFSEILERFSGRELLQCCFSIGPIQYYCSSIAPVLLFQFCSSTGPVLLQYCFSAVPTLLLCCLSTAPVLFQSCSSTVPVLHQYYSNTVSILFWYCSSNAPVLFQCCSNTVPV